MAYKFSNRSTKNLESVHPDLQALFNEVIKIYDCTIVFGKRTLEQQQELYAQGRTKPGSIVTYRDGIERRSKHQDGLAVDVAPYPIDWSDHKRFFFLAGVVKAVATQLNIEYRWGGDWDSDNDTSDQGWNDYPHFELI
jgi:peptidoglycan L-alanyl-D-glutamate endopeptidase CwlK